MPTGSDSMALSRLASAATAAALTCAACMQARAQTATDWQARLVDLYTLSVAIDVCDDLNVTTEDEDRLDKAISAVEAKLALTEEASAALYDQLSKTADSDRDGFCREIGPKVKTSIAKLDE